MTQCLYVKPCGSMEKLSIAQNRVAERLGPVRFVSANREHNAIMVAAQYSTAQRHVWNDYPCLVHKTCEAVHGPIVVIASDDDGNEVDLDVDSFVAWCNAVVAAHPAATRASPS